MNDSMIDLETWGTRPGSAIRSIAAVMFDPWKLGVVGAEFYMNVQDQSCLDAGLTMYADTVKFWDNQKPEAVAPLLVDQKPLKEVALAFNRWFSTQGGYYVWSQGANFDDPVWSEASRSVGVAPPWKFWNSRCTRTMYGIAGLNFNAMKRKGVAHHALDDAKHQILCVQRACDIMRGHGHTP